MTIVRNPAGWEYDTEAKTLAWPDAGLAPSLLPEVSLTSFIYFGMNYETSQAASRTVADGFKKAWAEAGAGRKAKDAPKDAVPKPDSDEYVAALLEVRKALFAKNLEGYELNAREGTADPVEEEIDAIARPWLQRVASHPARKWYVLPAARQRVAKDEDPYADPKGRYATFGEALAAFKVSTTESIAEAFAFKDSAGKPWPIKTRKGVSIGDLLRGEAERRVAEKKARDGDGVVAADASADVDF